MNIFYEAILMIHRINFIFLLYDELLFELNSQLGEFSFVNCTIQIPIQ